MTVRLNGQDYETTATNIKDLLAGTPMAGKPVIVELNQQALVASAYESTAVQEGDTIEVMILGAGG